MVSDTVYFASVYVMDMEYVMDVQCWLLDLRHQWCR